MYNEKTILAIIPARSGSKGFSHKNIAEIDGKPTLAYSIIAAQNSGIIDDIVVSTDSIEYAEIAKDWGAFVPFIRPDYLSTDEASTIDVILHTIKELRNTGREYDYLILLQPTSPLRKSTDITNAIKLCFEKSANSIISVCEAEHSPLWCNTIDEDLSMENFITSNGNKRRQEISTYYRLNGAIYISKVDFFVKNKSFYSSKAFAYIMDKYSSVDIDSQFDLDFARFLMLVTQK
ncbi:CMP-N-acetylneuraminic acid synthetase [Clostridium punense]|uniref:CMP-N-acetylneuraminic acid synthetase n=1 Tax=Clostridium punense TaxID=1054297 RepID=A0ABS4K205_9CLOT|nr:MULTISPECIES: acylneuraminate cytidylyltransferase family protein [Clostridium]EQB87125.1 hypothetical protein M918_10815 [Clostridium sp. BL8]MBP2021812.1 CMP-N-acetylneuraminic acid synthetase [Clostridium punense]